MTGASSRTDRSAYGCATQWPATRTAVRLRAAARPAEDANPLRLRSQGLRIVQRHVHRADAPPTKALSAVRTGLELASLRINRSAVRLEAEHPSDVPNDPHAGIAVPAVERTPEGLQTVFTSWM